MREFLQKLLVADFMPHGHCYFWQPSIVWLHVVSDALIALAYYSIPVMLIYFVRKRRDLAFHLIFVMFGLFILACGTTHVMEIWTLWHPVYRLSGVVKSGTAFVSLAAGVMLVRSLPQALALPSPAQLETANKALKNEISERKMAEGQVRKLNAELEERVKQRTAQLEEANRKLQAGIQECERAEEQIKASLHEKEVLLKEVHHRVNNNLQVMYSLINLQCRTVTDEATLQMFQDMRNRIRSMGLIHRMLYQSTDLSKIAFGEYIRNLTENLFYAYKVQRERVQFKIDVDEHLFLDIQMATPCGLIINELVSNSLKHAFPDNRGGEVFVACHTQDNQLKLTVSDNGIGLPPGFELQDTDRLGLRMVTMLIEQLDGSIQLDSSKGTQFTITFNQAGARKQ